MSASLRARRRPPTGPRPRPACLPAAAPSRPPLGAPPGPAPSLAPKGPPTPGRPRPRPWPRRPPTGTRRRLRRLMTFGGAIPDWKGPGVTRSERASMPPARDGGAGRPLLLLPLLGEGPVLGCDPPAPACPLAEFSSSLLLSWASFWAAAAERWWPLLRGRSSGRAVVVEKDAAAAGMAPLVLLLLWARTHCAAGAARPRAAWMACRFMAVVVAALDGGDGRGVRCLSDALGGKSIGSELKMLSRL